MKIILHFLIIVILTISTQIGGVIHLISILTFRTKSKKRKFKRGLFFIVIYLMATFLIVPIIAPIFGRKKIKETKFIEAKSFIYNLANRNYVRPELHNVLQRVSIKLNKKFKGVKLIYLDANFPFFNGFPLLPHLSHSDGKKIDISLLYENSEGKLNNKKPSLSGYGAYEEPRKGEYNQISICKKKGFWQYDFPKYLTLGKPNLDIKFSTKGTKFLVNSILKEKSVGKLFIEPHLKTRMKLLNSKVRFHGCQAVRHDDHIHFQLK